MSYQLKYCLLRINFILFHNYLLYLSKILAEIDLTTYFNIWYQNVAFRILYGWQKQSVITYAIITSDARGVQYLLNLSVRIFMIFADLT